MTNQEKKEIENKLELLDVEIRESRTYLKIALIALFFILIAFFTEKSFIDYLKSNFVFAVFILTILTLILISIIYLLSNIFLFHKHKGDDLKKDEKDSNRDWTE